MEEKYGNKGGLAGSVAGACGLWYLMRCVLKMRPMYLLRPALTPLPRLPGQFFDNTVDRPVSAKNDTGGFKPPFPVNCRPIDFDQWKSFEGSEESIGSEGTIR